MSWRFLVGVAQERLEGNGRLAAAPSKQREGQNQNLGE